MRTLHGVQLLVDFIDVFKICNELPDHRPIGESEYLSILQDTQSSSKQSTRLVESRFTVDNIFHCIAIDGGSGAGEASLLSPCCIRFSSS